MSFAVAASRCEQRFRLGLRRTRTQSLARGLAQHRSRPVHELTRARADRKRSEDAGKFWLKVTDALDREAAKKGAQRTRALASRQSGWNRNNGHCITSGCRDCTIRRAIRITRSERC